MLRDQLKIKFTFDLCKHTEKELPWSVMLYNKIYSGNYYFCRPKTILQYSGLTTKTGNWTHGVVKRQLYVQWCSPLYQTADWMNIWAYTICVFIFCRLSATRDVNELYLYTRWSRDWINFVMCFIHWWPHTDLTPWSPRYTTVYFFSVSFLSYVTFVIMTQWAKVVSVVPEQQINQIYSNTFPLEVRHFLAEWIEEQPW